jgi:hypothetical protein
MLFFIEEIFFNNLTSSNTTANNLNSQRRIMNHRGHSSPLATATTTKAAPTRKVVLAPHRFTYAAFTARIHVIRCAFTYIRTLGIHAYVCIDAWHSVHTRQYQRMCGVVLRMWAMMKRI